MPSRISGACTPCRSKKQKCSGHHPTCSQCANASIDCTWPEQRKRGPAKGYIEALESRLHSAESLLLAVLPLISDNVVERASNALQHDEDDDMEGTGGRRSSPPLLNKKTGLDYWEQFPLDTRRNIRKWQADCEANSSSSNITSTRRYRSPTHSPASASASTGIASPRNSTPNIPQTHTQPNTNQTWLQSMQPYVAPNPMQAGAAQQLLSLSNNQRHSRDQQQQQQQWMATTVSNPGSGPSPMQLDPNLMHQHPHQHQQHPHHPHQQHAQHHQQHQHQHQPRSMPHIPQAQHVYAGNVQQNLFW